MTTKSTKTAAVKHTLSASGKSTPQLRFRTRVKVGDVIAIGPGKIDLLEAIQETGSLTAAAKAMDMSYRRAWDLLDELNRSLKTPAVTSSKGGPSGGGSELTDAGLELIHLYRRIEATAEAACKADISTLISKLAR